MQLFFSDKPILKTFTLNEAESRHATKVLRLGAGDILWATDGRGKLFKCAIKISSPVECVVEVINSTPGNDIRNYCLTLAISPLKNTDRFEWFIEKAVEIGVDIITPIICERTEKPGIKRERLEKIIITAMKQSYKTCKTTLNEAVQVTDFINNSLDGKRLIAHCDEGVKKNISEIYKRGENCTIMIGPEGDFSKSEIEKAIAAGFSPISLGNSRLRTETAGIAACHSIYFLNL